MLLLTKYAEQSVALVLPPKSNSKHNSKFMLIIQFSYTIIQHAQSQRAAVVHYYFFSVSCAICTKNLPIYLISSS